MFETLDYLDASIDDVDGVIVIENEGDMPLVVERVTRDGETHYEQYAKPRSELVEELSDGRLERTGRKLAEDHVSAIRELADAPASRVSAIEEEYAIGCDPSDA